MSLEDPLFDGMFHGDGRVRVPGRCFCGDDTSDVEEAQCRTCMSNEPGPTFQPESPVNTSEQMHHAGVLPRRALHPRAVTTPTAMAVPLQTAAGTLSPHIPLVTASPLELSPSNETAQTAAQKAAQEAAQKARKKVTDRQSQQRRVGMMKELKSQNAAHEATIKTQGQTIRGLRASLAKHVGGKHNANSTTRGGLHEHLLITHYANWQSVKFALDQAYCKDEGSPRLAARSLFQDESGEVKVAGRFMWNPVGDEPFGGLSQLQDYANHLLEAGNGRLLFRCEGRFGRGMQILDSGDCNSLNPIGECDRTYLHRDWDNNRLNSLTIILALGNDVMGYIVRNDKGELEERIVTMKPGEMHIFPTSVYHFGCSHADYNNTIEGMRGQTKSSLRRRVFCYMDWDSTVKDEEGYVDSAKSCPVPKDYNLKIVPDIPNASVAFTYLSSPTLEGRTMEFENNKLVGVALAQRPLGKRARTQREQN
jgi:hypothetical protein